jgi:phage shock protein E
MIITITITAMFGTIKSLFAQSDNSKLKELIKDGAFLVDVRTPEEFSTGSVKNAVNIPLDQVQRQLSRFKEKKQIVVFCRSGSRSSQAKYILEQSGIKNVYNGGSLQNVKGAAAH